MENSSDLVTQANNAFLHFLDSCDIYLNDKLFSKELLLRAYANFIIKTNQTKSHDVGIALHTGSILFDAITVLYATVGNMVLNSIQTDDIVDSLQIGDMVTYNNGRYKFSGRGWRTKKSIPVEIILLKSEDKYQTEYTIYKDYWHLITPYKGKAKKTGKVGAGRSKKYLSIFYEKVLGYTTKDIPSLIDTSTVFILPKERADTIVKGITISFDKYSVQLTDLVTSAYYTENQEFHYAGNSGHNEPVLKFTNKFSVARELFTAKSGNKNIGLFVMGNDVIARGISELPALLNRKSLYYVFVSMSVDTEQAFSILDVVEERDVFVCTKNNLSDKSYSLPVSDNDLTNELANQVKTIVNRQVLPSVLQGLISWQEYKDFKKILSLIKESDYDSEEKESFVINAYSLVNIFMSSLFSISTMEWLITSNRINITDPFERIEHLKKDKTSFPAYLQEKADQIVSCVEKSYGFLWTKSPKESELKRILSEHTGQKIALIVPKRYYETILNCTLAENLLKDLDIYTPRKFNNSILYDLIIYTGNFHGDEFDIFRCKSAPLIQILLYECEEKIYRHKNRISSEKDKKLEAIAKHEPFTPIVFQPEIEQEIIEDEKLAGDLDDYINHLNMKVSFAGWNLSQPGVSNAKTETAAFVSFETGEKAFFTRMYKAYVLNDETGIVKEVPVEELAEGDAIIFTNNNEETHDIVDNILEKMIGEKGFSEEIIDYYKKSKEWKNSLINYMNSNNMSPADVAKKMKANGISVQELTIRTWLDEDSHTVGPRNVDSIRQIAYFTENEKMLDQAEIYHKACGEIRKIRMDILREIGKAIIANISGVKRTSGFENSMIANNIDSLSTVLRIESIIMMKKEIPTGFANRPLINRQGGTLYE